MATLPIWQWRIAIEGWHILASWQRTTSNTRHWVKLI